MISTHILDTSVGNPAPNVKVDLFYISDDSYGLVDSGTTDDDGRIKFSHDVKAGKYKLVFHIEDYYEKKGSDHFFTRAPVCFKIKDINRNYHVPLLLNPYGYSTYRGS